MSDFLQRLLEIKYLSPSITTFGLMLDILGAYLVAIEVRRVFTGHITNAATPLSGIHTWTNPAYTAHEADKRKTMKIGLRFLLCGFVCQGIGAWIPYAVDLPRLIPQFLH